jgi:hypothetical protein
MPLEAAGYIVIWEGNYVPDTYIIVIFHEFFNMF